MEKEERVEKKEEKAKSEGAEKAEEVKEALFYKKLKNDTVRCELCPIFCVIKNNERGNCKVRKNINGKLISLVYGKPCSIATDPIEKKPFYHFLPKEKALSIATLGCNFHCLNCQNAEISQEVPEKIPGDYFPPEKIVEIAEKEKVRIISYTYTEPTIFYEYMIDIAKLAKAKGIKNVIVSNGYINPKPLKQLCKYIDGANIDLKGISDKFYREICSGTLAPVLETLKILKENKIWTEVTNLIIPGRNDSKKDTLKLVRWVKKNLGKDVPLHFSAFFPCYKLLTTPPTSFETLKKARQIAIKEGMHYVYTGNISDEEGSTTFCPKCKKPVIKREGYYVIINNLKQEKCYNCKKKISGIF